MTDRGPRQQIVRVAQTRNLRAKSQNFSNIETTWGAFCDEVMSRENWQIVDKKEDASAIVAGPLATHECNKKTISGITILVSDHDNGWTMEESRRCAEDLLHEATIYPSFSNGKSRATIKHDDYLLWAEKTDHPAEIDEASGRAYLTATGKLLPSFAQGALFKGKRHTGEGVVYEFETGALDKHRVIRPLAKPVNFIEFVNASTTQADVIEAWSVAYCRVHEQFGAPFDDACKDPTRRYFEPASPRHADENFPSPIHVAGLPFDITAIFVEALEDVKAGRAGKGREAKQSRTRRREDGAGSNSAHSHLFNGFNLKTWAAQYAKTFDIESLMERRGLVKSARPHGGVFVDCHQENHSGSEQETFAANGDGEKGFVIHCSGQTGGCHDKDKLEHLIGYLNSEKIKLDDLRDVTLGGGDISNRAAREAGRKSRRNQRTRVVDRDGVGFDAAKFVADKLKLLDCHALNNLCHGNAQVGPTATAEDIAEHLRACHFSVQELIECCPEVGPPSTGYRAAIDDLARSVEKEEPLKAEIQERIEAIKKEFKGNIADIKKDLERIIAQRAQTRNEFGVLSSEETARLNSHRDYSEQFAIINTGGRGMVLNMLEPDLSKALMPHEDFKKLHKDDWATVEGDDGTQRTIFHADDWLKLPPDDAQFYRGGLVFKPTSSRIENIGADQYNLFSGFQVDPDPSGTCALLHDLIRDVWVQGDEDLLQWVVEYFMHPLRFPGDKVDTALAIRGTQGDGKSFITEKLMAPIYGDMLLRVANPRMVLGDFNEALAGKLLIALEEAAFAGDKSMFAKMKELITGDTVLINPKNKAPIILNNYARLIVTSNRHHFLDIEAGDRRYTVLNSFPAWKDTNKFEQLLDQWSQGGAARFVYDALNHSFRRMENSKRLVINTKVRTKHEAVQESESRSPLERFIVSFLLRGDFLGVASAEHLGLDRNGTDPGGKHEAWHLDKVLELTSQQLEDAVQEWYNKRAPGKVGHVPGLKTIIATLESYYGEAPSSRRALGHGRWGPTYRLLPKRRDALMFAYREGRITEEEFLSVLRPVAAVRKLTSYVVLSLPSDPDTNAGEGEGLQGDTVTP